MKSILQFISNAWALFLGFGVASGILVMLGQAVFTLRSWLWVVGAVVFVLCGIVAHASKKPQVFLAVPILALPMLLAGGLYVQAPKATVETVQNDSQERPIEAMLRVFFKP